MSARKQGHIQATVQGSSGQARGQHRDGERHAQEQTWGLTSSGCCLEPQNFTQTARERVGAEGERVRK